MSEEEKRFKVKKIEKYNDKLTEAKVEVVLYTFLTSLFAMLTVASHGIGVKLDLPGFKLSSLFSAGVSSVSISKKINEKWAGIIVTIVGTIAAIVYPMDDITDFLYLIGSVFAPMIAIQIADYFFLKKANSYDKSVNVKNLLVWLIGFICYRGLMRVETPVGNTLIDMVITILLCLIVNIKASGERGVHED